jgi:hypothetical protein
MPARAFKCVTTDDGKPSLIDVLLAPHAFVEPLGLNHKIGAAFDRRVPWQAATRDMNPSVRQQDAELCGASVNQGTNLNTTLGTYVVP